MKKNNLLSEGWKKGAQLAFPKFVICFKSLPSTLQVYISIFVGATKFSANKSLYSLISSAVLGREERNTNFYYHGRKTPPS